MDVYLTFRYTPLEILGSTWPTLGFKRTRDGFAPGLFIGVGDTESDPRSEKPQHAQIKGSSHPAPKSLTSQGQAVFLHCVGGSGDEVGDLIPVDVVS